MLPVAGEVYQVYTNKYQQLSRSGYYEKRIKEEQSYIALTSG